LITLGIDPGSLTTGWALLETKGNKTQYLSSGVLKFDGKKPFLQRITEIKMKVGEFINSVDADQVAMESLIFVKSPTSLIKLSQTRGIILACLIEKFEDNIFEYSPNLVKSTAVGHGHANKESVAKFLDMVLGKVNYKTHDESDAAAIALCHILNRGKVVANKKSSSSRSLSQSLAHKVSGV
tara:strand:- start:7687 stop:8232 length:546 start_codon:yes stop_codon:yes gene_type:complete